MAYRAEPRFTPRLIQVSALIASGATDYQIGRALGLSSSGARTHVNRLLALTGSSNRTEAAVRAVVDGIVQTPTGHAVVEVEHLQALMGALRQAETQCRAIKGVAAKFEATYPVLGATAPPHGATLIGNSHPSTRREEAP